MKHPLEEYYRTFAERMILRDHLAADRTELANERTLLAYIRTALTLFIAGASFVQFFGNIILIYLGWIFMPLGVAVTYLGFKRYYRMKKPLDELRKHALQPDEAKLKEI